MMGNKELLSVEEVCDLVGLSRPTLYRELNEGRLKASKLGRKTFISREALQEWIKGLAAYKPEAVVQ